MRQTNEEKGYAMPDPQRLTSTSTSMPSLKDEARAEPGFHARGSGRSFCLAAQVLQTGGETRLFVK